MTAPVTSWGLRLDLSALKTMLFNVGVQKVKKAFALLVISFVAAVISAPAQDTEDLQYKLLATTRTSTMQKEIDEVSARGYRIVVGSPTSGSEMVVLLSREGTAAEPFKYKLLATTRTGTMQKELNETAQGGFRLIPSTMISKESAFSGREIVVLLERPPKPTRTYQYKLLATNRTSTMQKEITEAKDQGYRIVGMISRDEHIVIMERETPIP